MVSIRRRVLGVTLLGLAVLLLAQPLAVWSALGSVRLPDLADPASLLGLAPPALVAAGATVLVSSLAAVRDRPLAPRVSLSTPLVAVAAGVALGVGAGLDPAALASLVLPDPYLFVVAGAVAGGSVAPVTLGALQSDTVTLLAGSAVLLVGTSLSPVPALALLAGVVGGGVAVALLWGLDAETWRP